MKFNKIPGHLMKIMCLVLSIILFICFCFSCVDAKAEGALEWMDIVFQYETEFRKELIKVNQKAGSAVNNSNLSSDTKSNILKILAVQELALRTMPNIYGFPIDPILPDGETVQFGGTASCGIYKSELDDSFHVVYFAPPFTDNQTSKSVTDFTVELAYSDEFDLKFHSVPTSFDSGSYFIKPSLSSNQYSIYYSVNNEKNFDIDFEFVDDKGYFTFGIHPKTFHLTSSNLYQFYKYGFIDGTTSPYTLPRKLNISTAFQQMIVLGHSQASVDLEQVDVSKYTPWDYYNDYLLPYIYNNYDVDNIDQYIAFPDGWYPNNVPPSQQYPTGGGVSIGNQYNFDIDINFPTYPNGEPQTDESGETITETVIVTDTRPSDAVYQFTVPTLPGLQIDSSPIPFNTNISEYTNPLLGFFDIITDIFDASGVLPVIPILFTMGIIFFVIYKCS